MDQLKVEVERIVEPVRAEMRLKNKFRQELWAHLRELYEEESASAPDSEAAARRALDRLGDADELRDQLRASMKRIDRIEGFGAYWWRPRTGVPLLRETLRLGISGFFSMYGMILALMAILWILPKGLEPDEALFMIVLGASAALMMTVFCVVMPWIEGVAPRISLSKTSRRRLSIKTIQWSALSALIFLALGVVVHFAGHAFLAFVLGPDHDTVILFDFVNSALWRWLGGTMLIALFAVFLGELYFTNRLPDWPYADVDEPRDGGREGFENVEHTIR